MNLDSATYYDLREDIEYIVFFICILEWLNIPTCPGQPKPS